MDELEERMVLQYSEHTISTLSILFAHKCLCHQAVIFSIGIRLEIDGKSCDALTSDVLEYLLCTMRLLLLWCTAFIGPAPWNQVSPMHRIKLLNSFISSLMLGAPVIGVVL